MHMIIKSGGFLMTITHSSIQMDMDEILAEINKITSNRYIEEYVTLPEISVVRLKLLYISLYDTSVSRDVRKIYCVAAGLIQMGLDLHENVTNYKEPSHRSMRNRQLSILAGDYYSSHYYSLLAENNLTDDIKIFASAIRNINIAKMKLYTDSYDVTYGSLEHFFKLAIEKETSLYTYFLEKFHNEKEKALWQDIIENMIILNQLSHELQTKTINRHDFSFYFINYFANFDERNEINKTVLLNDVSQSKLGYFYRKYDIESKIADLIAGSYNQLLKTIEKLNNRTLKNELNFMLSRFPNSFQDFKLAEKI